jgi:hypothetical protein
MPPPRSECAPRGAVHAGDGRAEPPAGSGTLAAPMLVELLIGGGFLGTAAGLFLRNYYSEASRHRRALGRAKLWRIGELPEDTVGRVVGTVRAVGGTLKAPLTGRACVCYRVTADDPTGQTAIRDQRGLPFALEDSSGRALVDPDGAALDRRAAYDSSSSSTRGLTRPELDFLEANGAPSRDWIFGRELTLREEIVEDGETICVAGAGVREADPDAAVGEGYRNALATRVRLASSPRFQILITEAPAEKEWRRSD